MTSNRFFTNSLWRLAMALCFSFSLVGTTYAAQTDAFGTTGAEDPYKARLMDQLKKLDLKPDQVEEFQQLVNEYFERRNGAQRRIGRQGGAIDVRVRRDLRRVENQAVDAMGPGARRSEREYPREPERLDDGCAPQTEDEDEHPS